MGKLSKKLWVLAAGILFFTIIQSIVYSQESMVKYDFGRVSIEQQVTHRFNFEREIIAVASMCECLSARILPYAVEVVFNPQGYQGEVVSQVRAIESNDNLIILEIKALVY